MYADFDERFEKQFPDDQRTMIAFEDLGQQAIEGEADDKSRRPGESYASLLFGLQKEMISRLTSLKGYDMQFGVMKPFAGPETTQCYFICRATGKNGFSDVDYWLRDNYASVANSLQNLANLP